MSNERKQQISRDFQEKMNDDELLNCMRCGFCLPSCPTYIETGGYEGASPRGRISLMKAVADGMIEPDQDLEDQLSLCLGCRACEPACPSGVKYGQLVEQARDILQEEKQHSLPVRTVRRVVFDEVFPHKKRMRKLVGLMWFYQKTGIQKLARATKAVNIAGRQMGMMEKVLPNIPSPKELKKRPTYIEPKTTKTKRVAFFSGCLMDTMFMKTNDSTLYLLQESNCEVVIPEEQNCCGALHGHSGEKGKAKQLAKRNIEAFEKLEDIDHIVLNSGGCGAFLTDYDELFHGDPEWEERAKEFSNKVLDISEVLVEVGPPKMVLEPQVITYQDSCHLRNVMKTASAPRQLLQSIEGVTYKEMKQADRCCGSAGIYNLIETEMSMQILDEKMVHATHTDATTIVTANPGCLLQMKLGIEREQKSEHMKGVHIVDLLADAVRHYQEKYASHSLQNNM
ncbi:(Fe-S)-binding protein [Texcoconibacillus texcoconensis]|nr:(Fe-S)-binding protein [Texcoconibacillus texcoconensis]